MGEANAMNDVTLMLGDCLERMGEIADGSVDAIVTDPPYPEVARPYGRMTEAEWHVMMRGVVAESRRILKPPGSAVFILQPNNKNAGSMRLWLWEFVVWIGREWNLVQDVYWWNTTALPLTKNDPNTLRSSVKICVWFGASDCYRDASSVRWTESEANRTKRIQERAFGHHVKNHKTRVNENVERARTAVIKNGGVTPFNLLPIGAGGPRNPSFGHGAPTPFDVCDWWVRYISPEGGTVCDPFAGSGTVGLAALKRGRKFIGIERDSGYFDIASARIAAHCDSMPLLAGVAS